MSANKPWPKDCPWPEPIWDGEGQTWELDLIEMTELDDEGEELKSIKDYMDDLVKEGRLNKDYSLNEDYEVEEDDEPWEPEKGIDYWDNGFDIETWQEDVSSHINLLKIDVCENDPVADIRQIINYSFLNENLLRQAFTRRAFGEEHDTGNSEQLEFYGDMILNTVVTRELFRNSAPDMPFSVETPFSSFYSEGELSKIRAWYVSKDYLSKRAQTLGLNRFILYGKGEEETESSCEDMMEALIGAVAIDCNWNWDTIEGVVDVLICLQMSNPDEILKKSHYEIFNSWHQKKFGRMPEYEVFRNRRRNGTLYYDCSIRFSVPENDKDIWTSQRIDVDGETRSSAREFAAKKAYNFVVGHGLWMNLKDAGIEPDLEKAINQLQELYQKKYVGEPKYQFEDRGNKKWSCACNVDGIEGWGTATGKVGAKKKAAFVALVRLMMSAGLSTEEMEKAMWKTME